MRRGQDRDGRVAMFTVAEQAHYMLNVSALGIPALSFPMGKYEDAPIGVQIGAHAWREDLILEAGHVLEASRGKVVHSFCDVILLSSQRRPRRQSLKPKKSFFLFLSGRKFFDFPQN